MHKENITHLALFDMVVYFEAIPAAKILDPKETKIWSYVSSILKAYYLEIEWSDMDIESCRNHMTNLLEPVGSLQIMLQELCNGSGDRFFTLNLKQIIRNLFRYTMVTYMGNQLNMDRSRLDEYMTHIDSMISKCSLPNDQYKKMDNVIGQMMLDLQSSSPERYQQHSTSYDRQKLLFEMDNAKVLNQACFVHGTRDTEGNTKWVRMSHNKFVNTFSHLTYEKHDNNGIACTKRFIHQWIHDPRMRVYDDIISDPTKPTGSYEKYINTFPVMKHAMTEDVDDYHTTSEPYFEFAKTLLGEQNSEFFFAWLKHVIESPESPTRIAMVLSGSEGTGKSTLFDFIRFHILGLDTSAQIAKISELTDKHSNVRENCVLLQFDEVSPNVFNKNQEFFKDLITTNTIRVNPKGHTMYAIPSYCNVVFTTNSKIPLLISDTDRRYVSIKVTDTFRMDEKFWTSFARNVMKDKVGKAVVQRLRATDYSHMYPLEFHRPKTNLYDEVRILSIPTNYRFLSYFSRNNSNRIINAKDLQTEYIHWCKERHIEPRPKTFVMEVMKLPEDESGVSKKRSSSCHIYTIDTEKLKQHLIRINQYHESDHDGYRESKRQKVK